MTKFAMIFPGQGSQSQGMLTNLAIMNPIVEKTFRQASEILNYDLWQLVKNGSAEQLSKTSQTQPALLTASVAIFRTWKEKGGKLPIILAGHSLGEYSALVCSEVITFTDAIKIVELRGKLMQEAIPKGTGAMVAIIGLDNTLINKICKESEWNQVVAPVNFNSTKQIVIAGHKEAVERASKACKLAGARHVFLLPISVPSHCTLMKPAAAKLEIALKTIKFNKPIIPVVNNVDVKCETLDEAIRSALVRQLYNPVRWIECIKFISLQGVTSLLEMGPGNVLTKLTKHIDDTLRSVSIHDQNSLLTALKRQRELI